MNECEGLNWHTQGVTAGTLGISEHEARLNFETCAEGALQFERDSYIDGYRKGIDTYCTKEIGFVAGLKGSVYQDVCPENKEGTFLTGYNAGIALFVADVELRAAKLAFASSAAPSTFIGSPPSAEHNRFRLETFPQTTETARALLSQMRWQQPQRSGEVTLRTYGKRDLTSVISRCEAAKKVAEELGFMIDDVC